jgi:hypothetical protein
MVQSSAPSSQVNASSAAGTAKTALIGVAIGVGVFALLALGGGGYLVLRAKTRAAPPAVAAPAVPTATTEAEVKPALVAEIPIKLVEPTNGVTLLLDGVVQPVGKLSVERPKEGATRKLTARALGYLDLETNIDSSTQIVALELKKDTGEQDEQPETESAPEKSQEPATKAEPATAKAEPATAKPSPEPKSSTPTASKPKPKPVKPDIPDNPF